MSISDLSGTTWVLNDTLDMSAWGVNVNTTFHITFECDGDDYDGFQTLYRAEQTNGIKYAVEGNFAMVYNFDSGWADQKYRTITITGGTDATNQTLKDGLEANATQVTVSDLTNTTWVVPIFTTTSSNPNTYNVNFDIVGHPLPYDNHWDTLYTPLLSMTTANAFAQSTWIYYLNVVARQGDNVWEVYDIDQIEILEYISGDITITFTGGTDATNINLIAWLTANATQQVEPTAVFDLDTLELPAGTYTITAKAEGSGFQDSVASNSVSYTVAPSGYTVTFTKGSNCYDTYDSYRQYSLDGTTWNNITYAMNGTTLNNVTSIYFKTSGNGYNRGTLSWTNPTGSIDFTAFDYSSTLTSGEITLTGNMVVTYSNTNEPE